MLATPAGRWPAIIIKDNRGKKKKKCKKKKKENKYNLREIFFFFLNPERNGKGEWNPSTLANVYSFKSFSKSFNNPENPISRSDGSVLQL